MQMGFGHNHLGGPSMRGKLATTPRRAKTVTIVGAMDGKGPMAGRQGLERTKQSAWAN